MSKPILGIIGGGQLGSMLVIAANKLEIKTVIYCDDIDAPAQNFCNKFIYGNYNDIKKINELNNKKSSLLYSLCLRTSYGGMNGDIQRFQSFIKLWLQYFEKKNDKINLLYEKIRPIRINDEMTTKDIHSSSIDFHIFPVVKNIKKLNPIFQKSLI